MANNNPPKFEAIIYEVTGPVATITLNRPEMANAQNTQLIDEVDAAFDLADADDRVRVVVLAGRGRHFSSGHDLKALVGDTEPDEWRLMRETPEGKYHHEKVMYFDRCLRIRNFRKPTIAAVQGKCIAAGVTPVISPTARGEDGRIYNCNADVAAAQVAIALKARRLVFMSDVPGLMRDPSDPDTVIPHLNVREVDELKAAGIVAQGMIPKVDSGVAAVRAGVDKVSFVDGRVPHAVLLEIFTDQGVGTEVVA
jgi:hypothetical protein